MPGLQDLRFRALGCLGLESFWMLVCGRDVAERVWDSEGQRFGMGSRVLNFRVEGL